VNSLEKLHLQTNIEKLEIEHQKLEAEVGKLYAEAKYFAKQVDREGWRLLFYAIGTGVALITALVAAARLGGAS
jgi:hypothetical protein